ncbi:MAG: TerC family protein [Acidobacteria bacterium]|nr:TerC family protein [Acidobacteriota bacterium]
MDWLTDPQAWIALITLTALEIVLGIDNIIFISILVGKLPPRQQGRARSFGLAAAMVSRILLLLCLSWLVRLTEPLLQAGDYRLSGRDLILILGGVFLLFKATSEIHQAIEHTPGAPKSSKAATFGTVIAQILVLDVVFSLDSVITAVGMADRIAVMVAAVMISVGIMLFAARPISEFVEHRPTVKMLALSFLLMVGLTLVADGLGHHIPKGYVYFAMAFSVMVEMLNLRASRRV